MNGKNYSVPLDMVLQKHYCHKCGGKLEKEKTHRVVTKDDRDYYRYHDAGTYPKPDYDIYEYRYRCPSCQARISHDEQAVIDRIQKKLRRTVLTSSDVKANYKECKESDKKRALVSNIGISIVMLLIVYAIGSLFASREDLSYLTIGIIVLAILSIINEIRRYKGKKLLGHRRSYSDEEEARLKKLHAYSSHNRALVEGARQCHCFYCRATVDASEVVDYTDNGQTAICPKCGIDSILPDSIEDTLNADTIAEMNEYWF